MTESKPFTHSAYIFKNEGLRKGRRLGRWIDEGVARLEPDGSFFVYLHSTPLGGFDGRIRCVKIGSAPPDTNPAPQRPGDGEESDDEDGATKPSRRRRRVSAYTTVRLPARAPDCHG